MLKNIRMKHTIKTGFSFGVTSGVITTLGLMAGLESGTGQKATVLGGILAIAISDAFSDALGMHMSEEAAGEHTPLEIWESTLATFFTKFFSALTFAVPLFFLDLRPAVIVAVIWGFSLLVVFNYVLAARRGESAAKLIAEHLGIAVFVIVVTHYVGRWIASAFGTPPV